MSRSRGGAAGTNSSLHSHDDALHFLADTLPASPLLLFEPDVSTAATLKQALKTTHDHLQATAARLNGKAQKASAAPAAPLLVDGFDVDQVWAQMELLHPNWKRMQKRLTALERHAATLPEPGASDVEDEEEGSDSDSDAYADADADSDDVAARVAGSDDGSGSDVLDGDSDDDGDDSEAEAGVGAGAGAGAGSSAAPAKKLSKHALRQLQLLQQIKALEAEAIGEKEWSMKGELSSGKRPKNSLVDATVEYETATKLAPEVTVEATQELEDVIKQRIKDEAWDDVVRAPPEEAKRRQELPDVSTDKSKLGLGEVYEEEYKKVVLGQKEDDGMAAKHAEVKDIFAKLCHRLDALSNFHFTPKPPKADMAVTASVPAIDMEEKLPIAVSDAATKAPEEVYQKKRGRAAVLVARDEMTPQEKQTERRGKKAARRKRRKATGSKWRDGGGAGMGALKNVTQATASTDGAAGKYGKSNAFFASLQERVAQDLHRKAAAKQRVPAGGRVEPAAGK